jgi:hypothetical protein
VQAPFVSGDSATRVALTVTPLSVLVPFTNAHIFTAIADGFTVFVSSSEVFGGTITVVAVVADVEPKDRPRTVSVEPETFVTEPNANPKFAFPPKPPGGRCPLGGVPLPPPGRVPPRNAKPPPHWPFTGAEIVIRVAVITPLPFRDPVATERGAEHDVHDPESREAPRCETDG